MKGLGQEVLPHSPLCKTPSQYMLSLHTRRCCQRDFATSQAWSPAGVLEPGCLLAPMQLYLTRVKARILDAQQRCRVSCRG